MYRRAKPLFVAGALALALIAAACGSSSKSQSSATTAGSGGSSGTTAAASNGAPIKIGVVCSCSGAFGSNFATAMQTYKSWVNTVNAAGGINGHQVQLDLKDDAGSPGTSVTDLQSLLSDHVTAIVTESIADETWAGTVKAAGIPVVGGDVTETPFYNNSDFYPEGQTEDALATSFVSVAKAAGLQKLAYFYCTESVSCSEEAGTISGVAQKLGGPSVIYKAGISATAPNYTAQCEAAKQAGVDAIINGDSDSIFERAAADCTTQGVKVSYISSGESFDPTMLTSSGVKDNAYFMSNDLPWFNKSVPAVQAMDNAVNKYYPGVVDKVQSWSGLSSVQTWASGILLEDAVKAANIGPSVTPTPALIIKGLDALHGDTLQGLAPPLTFKAGQPNPIDCWFTFAVHNGTPSMSNNSKVTCQTPPS